MKPEALRLAEWCDLGHDPYDKSAAAELRRLHKEVGSFNSILDQAFKDQTDAERYMHLKWVITEKPIYFLQLIDKTGDQIDQLMDEHIRSYDE